MPNVFAERRTRDRVCIIGFTQHQNQAPWKDTSCDFWGLNDLHGSFEAFAPGIFKTDRVSWFQLHREDAGNEFAFHGVRDPNHFKWMTEQTCPIYMWQVHRAIPASLEYPILDVLNYRVPGGGLLSPERYYNNSISWMIAAAILAEYPEIAIYGVDMACNGVHGQSEYAYQRPSVEYFIGAARALGRTVILPQESEICKAGYLYGWDNATHWRRKLITRHDQLVQQEAEAVDNYEAIKREMFALRGAISERKGFLTPEQQATDERLQLLMNEEAKFSGEYEHTKRVLHETRGALNDNRWSLSNYWAGEGTIQDVPRTERSFVLPSDGRPAEPAPVNRLAALTED